MTRGWSARQAASISCTNPEAMADADPDAPVDCLTGGLRTQHRHVQYGLRSAERLCDRARIARPRGRPPAATEDCSILSRSTRHSETRRFLQSQSWRSLRRLRAVMQIPLRVMLLEHQLHCEIRRCRYLTGSVPGNQIAARTKTTTIATKRAASFASEILHRTRTTWQTGQFKSWVFYRRGSARGPRRPTSPVRATSLSDISSLHQAAGFSHPERVPVLVERPEVST